MEQLLLVDLQFRSLRMVPEGWMEQLVRLVVNHFAPIPHSVGGEWREPRPSHEKAVREPLLLVNHSAPMLQLRQNSWKVTTTPVLMDHFTSVFNLVPG